MGESKVVNRTRGRVRRSGWVPVRTKRIRMVYTIQYTEELEVGSSGSGREKYRERKRVECGADIRPRITYRIVREARGRV